MPKTILITMFDTTRTLAAWMAELGATAPAHVIRQRLGRGWEEYTAITTPLDTTGKAAAAALTRRKRELRLQLATGHFRAFGKFQSIAAWARERGLPVATLRMRLAGAAHRGESFEQALEAPYSPRPQTPASLARRLARPIRMTIPPGEIMFAFIIEREEPRGIRPHIVAIRQTIDRRHIRRLGFELARRELPSGRDPIVMKAERSAVLAWHDADNPWNRLVVKPWRPALLRTHTIAPDCPIPGAQWKRGAKKGRFRPN